MYKHLFSACLLLLVQNLLFGQNSKPVKQSALEKIIPYQRVSNVSKNDATADWQSKAQSYISASEYFFNSIAGNGNYSVANKKQRTGFIVSGAGFTVSPVRFSENANNDWRVSMQLKYIGKGSANIFNTAYQSCFNADENRLTVKHNDFSIDYLNNEAGLRQNFVINKKPAGDEALSIRMQVTGDLHAFSTNNTLQFKDAKGVTKLY